MSAEQIMERLKQKADRVLMGYAMEVHANAVDSMSQAGRGARRGNHTASAPGDAPATDSGLLKGSVQFARLGPLAWGVGVVDSPYPDGKASTAETAVYLEFGTRLMAARPFMRPALEKFKAKRLGGSP